jgi:hypothetical protein
MTTRLGLGLLRGIAMVGKWCGCPGQHTPRGIKMDILYEKISFSVLKKF